MWVMTRYIYTLEVSQHLREGLRNMFLNEGETSSYPKIRITKMDEFIPVVVIMEDVVVRECNDLVTGFVGSHLMTMY